MSVEKRSYRKKARAAAEERTRLWITKSAVELHGTIGPAQTSISTLAQHAGVRRSTVYHHFPDVDALFAACSAHWQAANPPPDLAHWTRIGSPDERLSVALRDLYAYYHATERMFHNVLRDEPAVPVLTQTLAGYRAYLAAARDVVLAGSEVSEEARPRVIAAIGHALAFNTWQSLVREQGLDDVAAADLMCRLISAAVQAPPGAKNAKRTPSHTRASV